MKILIFGGGAVGLGIASCLIKSGERVDIYDRKNTIEALKENGLWRAGIFGEFHADSTEFGAYDSLIAASGTEYDYILVCTKSYDTAAAAEAISNSFSGNTDSTKFLLVQNGWGNAGVFTGRFPESQVYSARVITGFTKQKQNEVEITVHADAIHLGSLYHDKTAHLQELCDSITRGGIPCEITDSVEKDLWAKMLYNCLLNPLGAIFKVPYGRLGESGYTRAIMKKIAEEIFAVMDKAGYETHWESADGYLETFYSNLLPPTSAHEASMLQDIRAGRRTEIDAMNGEVVRLGERHGVPAPVNRTIYSVIRFMEEGPSM